MRSLRELFPPPIAALFLAAASSQGAPARADTTGALTVGVTGLRSARGQVGCMLYGSERGFPTDPGKALERRWCPIGGTEARCTFHPVPAGTYAVACFHDENGNGKMDFGLFGIPVEGNVVSNHARGFLGPPSFDSARFTLSGRPAEMTLRIAY
jgi:uncharacterized protein (DUF2141 family)